MALKDIKDTHDQQTTQVNVYRRDDILTVGCRKRDMEQDSMGKRRVEALMVQTGMVECEIPWNSHEALHSEHGHDCYLMELHHPRRVSSCCQEVDLNECVWSAGVRPVGVFVNP